MAKICIDAGHGGLDSGAVGADGQYESNINLIVARRLRLALKDKHEVVLTRNSNVGVSLGERCRIANSANADLFISIHCNSAVNREAHGIETFKYPTSKSKLANNIQDELVKATGAKNRGVKTNQFYVLKNTKMSACLVEIGFLSNLDERKKITSTKYQTLIVDAIVKGIELTL